jgi:hypothetical protein
VRNIALDTGALSFVRSLLCANLTHRSSSTRNSLVEFVLELDARVARFLLAMWRETLVGHDLPCNVALLSLTLGVIDVFWPTAYIVRQTQTDSQTARQRVSELVDQKMRLVPLGSSRGAVDHIHSCLLSGFLVLLGALGCLCKLLVVGVLLHWNRIVSLSLVGLARLWSIECITKLVTESIVVIFVGLGTLQAQVAHTHTHVDWF